MMSILDFLEFNRASNDYDDALYFDKLQYSFNSWILSDSTFVARQF